MNVPFDQLIEDVEGLRGTLGAAELRQVYRQLARRYHPDTGRDGASQEAMAWINMTYDELRKGARSEAVVTPPNARQPHRSNPKVNHGNWKAYRWRSHQPSSAGPSKTAASAAGAGGSNDAPGNERPKDAAKSPSMKPGKRSAGEKRNDRKVSRKGSSSVLARLTFSESERQVMEQVALVALDDWLEHSQGLPRETAKRRAAVTLGLRRPGHCPAIHLPVGAILDTHGIKLDYVSPLEAGANIVIFPVIEVVRNTPRLSGAVRAILRDVPTKPKGLKISRGEAERHGFREDSGEQIHVRLNFDADGVPLGPMLLERDPTRYRGLFR